MHYFKFCYKWHAISTFIYMYTIWVFISVVAVLTVYNACSRCHSYLDVSLFFRNLLTSTRDLRRRNDCCTLLNMVNQRRKKARGGIMHDFHHQTYTKNCSRSFASIHCNLLPHQPFPQYSLLALFPGLTTVPLRFCILQAIKN